MTTITILLATACVVFLIALFLKCQENERLNERMEEITDREWKSIADTVKKYRRKYLFLNIEKVGNNDSLNIATREYYNIGYDLDREKSTDRLLVFVKFEEDNKDN